MTEPTEPTAPAEPAEQPKGGRAPAPFVHPPESPISDQALDAVRAELVKLWKRIEKRAPDHVRDRVTTALSLAEARIGNALATLRERVELGKLLEELLAEVRGRKAFEPSFYTDGRFGIIRERNPVVISGAIDHARVEKFFDRYMRRAEAAFERLEYFLTRAGLLQPKEKPKKPAWEQPYANLEQYHELIWGKKKAQTKTPGKPKPR